MLDACSLCRRLACHVAGIYAYMPTGICICMTHAHIHTRTLHTHNGDTTNTHTSQVTQTYRENIDTHVNTNRITNR